MKFSKEDIGVFVSGATLYTPTEQTFAILEFAIANGYEMNVEALETAKKSYEFEYDSLDYEWFEHLEWELEYAIEYLNTQCVGEGVAFTFRDTDFVLIGGNEFE